jgi:sugar phosphate isomerase/epimerase
MDRREFGQATAAALTAATVGIPSDRLERVGLQLYTVRRLLAKDPEGTLAAVKEAGYAEVEFAGYAGLSAKAVAAMLRRVGLSAPSGHIDLAAIRDRWPATLAFAREVGHRWLVLAWLAEEDRKTVDQIKRLGEQLNRAASEAKAAGIQFGYHNHDFEFVPVEGRLPYDVLLESTDPSLVKLELDLYWITKGGQDPLRYFAKWPGRFPMVHVKDMAKGSSGAMVDVGMGRIDFAAIFSRAKAAGIEHYFVEHDEPKDPIAFARAARRYLARLEF